MRMAQNHDNLITLLSAFVEAMSNKCRPNPMPLILRQNRHRSQGNGRNGAVGQDDRQVADQNMPDDSIILFGDQREASVATVTQSFD